MRKIRFTEAQIIGILQEAAAGATINEVCRRHEIAAKTYYRWKQHFGGMAQRRTRTARPQRC
jgi:putative transposase